MKNFAVVLSVNGFKIVKVQESPEVFSFCKPLNKKGIAWMGIFLTRAAAREYIKKIQGGAIVQILLNNPPRR